MRRGDRKSLIEQDYGKPLIGKGSGKLSMGKENGRLMEKGYGKPLIGKGSGKLPMGKGNGRLMEKGKEKTSHIQGALICMRSIFIIRRNQWPHLG